MRFRISVIGAAISVSLGLFAMPASAASIVIDGIIWVPIEGDYKVPDGAVDAIVKVTYFDGGGTKNIDYPFGVSVKPGDTHLYVTPGDGIGVATFVSWTYPPPLPPPGPPYVAAVPEPSTWAMLLVGFGAMGYTTRGARRKQWGAIATT